MMGRFLSLTIVLMVVIGLLIHFDVDVPIISSWMGQLPGDLILQKESVTIYLPFTTAAIFSAGLSLLGSLFSK